MTSFHLCFKGKREAEIKFEIERVYKNREKTKTKQKQGRGLCVSQQVVRFRIFFPDSERHLTVTYRNECGSLSAVLSVWPPTEHDFYGHFVPLSFKRFPWIEIDEIAIANAITSPPLFDFVTILNYIPLPFGKSRNRVVDSRWWEAIIVAKDSNIQRTPSPRSHTWSQVKEDQIERKSFVSSLR